MQITRKLRLGAERSVYCALCENEINPNEPEDVIELTKNGETLIKRFCNPCAQKINISYKHGLIQTTETVMRISVHATYSVLMDDKGNSIKTFAMRDGVADRWLEWAKKKKIILSNVYV